MQTSLLSAIGRNRYTIGLLVLVATVFLTGATDAGGCGHLIDSCGCDTPLFPVELTVTVVDRVTGKALPGAGLQLVGGANNSLFVAYTLDDGTVDLDHLYAGSYSVRADHIGYLSNSVDVTVDRSNSPTTVQIPLSPTGGTITGKVTDAKTNSPISGATVTLSPTGFELGGTTDATGVYTLNNVATGIALTARATKDKYDPKTLTPFTLGPNENKTGVDFALTQTTTATGTVTVTVLDATTATRVPTAAITSVTFGGVPLVLNSSAGTYGSTAAAVGTNVPLTINATGYTTATRNLTLATGQNLNVTVPLSPVFPTTSAAPVCEVAGKSLRITLDWQKNAKGQPAALNLEVVVPYAGKPNGCYLDQYFHGNLCSSPFARLRVENSGSASLPTIETVDLSQLTPGTYLIAVEDSTPSDPATILGDPNTAATVTVYGPKGVMTATAPVATGAGYRDWVPFTIDGATGDVKPAPASALTQFLVINDCSDGIPTN